MPSKLFKWGPTDHHWFSSFVIVEYKTSLLFFPGFPDQMSCLDTGDPTRVSNRTSVKCAKRSSPAVTICPNTSKSTVFRESAGQFARQTEAWLETLENNGNNELALIQTCHGSKMWIWIYRCGANVHAYIKSVWVCRLCLLIYCKPTQ